MNGPGLTIYHKASVHTFGAVVVSTTPALIAGSAGVPYRLDTRALANFEISDPFPDFDDHA